MTENASKALIDNGVPEDLAHKVSEIVSKDDPSKENLGRSEEQQETINQATNLMNQYWRSIQND